MLKRSILPRTILLIRGCVTPKSFAASTWVRLRPSMTLRTAIMRVDRIRRCSASASSKPRSLKTFPLDGVIFVSMDRATSCGVADFLPVGFSKRPDTSLGQAQGHAERSAVSSSERHARRRLLLRTLPSRRPDAPRQCVSAVPGHRGQRWSWASSHPAQALVESNAAHGRQGLWQPLGKLAGPEGWSLPRRASSWPSGTIQLSVYRCNPGRRHRYHLHRVTGTAVALSGLERFRVGSFSWG
jgi:hypothetical protein